MNEFLWVLVELGENISAFIAWFFLVAFLFHLSSSINKPNKSAVQLSCIMMVSYFLSSFLSLDAVTYLDYFMCDAVTIFIVLIWYAKTKFATPAALIYLITGMSVNALLFLGMHYDVVILKNEDYWWFWAVYAIGTISIDLLMALALIVNKDILGLEWAFKQTRAGYLNIRRT